MTSENKELFIFTREDMDMMKQESLRLIAQLPDDLKSALIIVAFMKENIEQATGCKIEKVFVK